MDPHIYFRSDKAYGAWLSTQPIEGFGSRGWPRTYRARRVTASKKLEPAALDGVEGFRMYEAESSAFGQVAGWPVWIKHRPRTPLRVWCADETVPDVKTWVQSHKGTLRSESAQAPSAR